MILTSSGLQHSSHIISFILSLSSHRISSPSSHFQIDPDTRPTVVGPPFTGHFRVTADTPRGLVPFGPAASVAPPQMGDKPEPRSSTDTATDATATSANLQLRKNVYQTSALSDKARAVVAAKNQVHCGSCSAECTVVRYHCVKTKDLDVCPSCFLEGRFSSTLNSGDFVKINSTLLQRTEEEEWSEEETLLLLEGIEMYDEDWTKIAEHVGTRSREQCVLKFLQLPIEDDFLESNPAELGPLQYRNVPFSQADNPVMSVVAFLASVVNPGVASAAAKAALQELTASSSTTAAPASPKKGKEARSRSSSPTRTQPTENGHGSTKPSPQVVVQAATAALAAASVKAKVLADFEEREIQRLVNSAIEAQMNKIELKMSQFEELEVILERERQELERQRQQIFVDRLQLQKAIIHVQGGGDGALQMLKAVAADGKQQADKGAMPVDAIMTTLS